MLVNTSMPKTWMHTYSLQFECFGPFSDHRDPDLNLTPSDGSLDDDDAEGSATLSEE